ncbi:GntR family transcriptional regulator [Microtetraspora sp. AC03309]|uniref:GntR family transcriptional regulator n=1 Tax=Microtetraspora sp. AC03309 TaxID=2779376 RepID=UPI001E3323B7|nr:GntR family transcriptional regulator [Microtetraspora sp. AC03309]MCC5575121.1 GntR family transcriptional regulator [Microtetraspora sp. AC03309]
MLDRDGDTHVYLQIAEILRRQIMDGALRPGQPVPSEAMIQREFGVARTTARRSMGLLRDEGLVHAIRGEGTFVGSPGDAPRVFRKTPLFRQIADDVIGRIRRGELRPRRPIPSETTLLQQYDVARETVRRAIALLREEKWVYTVPQRGSFVSPEENWPAD